jgi:hypothetical protein
MVDRKGQDLEVGDRVTIECKVVYVDDIHGVASVDSVASKVIRHLHCEPRDIEKIQQ